MSDDKHPLRLMTAPGYGLNQSWIQDLFIQDQDQDLLIQDRDQDL